MIREIALQKREQMIRDGFCAIDNILTEEFLQELRDESERLIANYVQPDHTRYHGHHILVAGKDNTLIQKLLEWHPTLNALEEMGFGDFTGARGITILTKDPGAPPLYWHQDWYYWNDPISCAPWPQHIFMKYYLTDTKPENGCLKVIPSTHRKRIDLHDKLLYASKQGNVLQPGSESKEKYSVMFSDHPGQVDVCVKAGSLVMRDARLLHSVRKNHTDRRRTMLLVWISRPNTIPDYWNDEIPEPVLNRDENEDYPSSQIPNEFLKGNENL